jgi:hypothetical protein
LALTWGDVDFERGRVRVPSPKTEHCAGKEFRVIPLWPELRPHLEDALYGAGEVAKTEPIIVRYRDAGQNLGTGFTRIIRRAGPQLWERVFHNLRASRQNELAAEFPIHVVCQWVGNSQLIAGKHYLSVMDDYFEAALTLDAQCYADDAGQGQNELKGSDISPANSAIPLKNRGKHYPQGESNPCPLAENQIS